MRAFVKFDKVRLLIPHGRGNDLGYGKIVKDEVVFTAEMGDPQPSSNTSFFEVMMKVQRLNVCGVVL
jgi:hypothetical protein